MLGIAGVRKRYGETVALDGVDLTVEPGEICGLLGPNGAGKTSLVSIVAGLRTADEGTVRVGEVDVTADPEGARRLLGLAPQELGIYPPLTTRDNLVFFGELAGLRGGDLRRRIDGVADSLELTDLLERQAATMSGGEKRRLHTAMAMLHQPPLLLLDEPTTGVDVSTRAHLIEVVRALADDGTAVCYSTHYLGEVEQLGASVAILDRGRMIARGTVAELIAQHGEAAVELEFEGDAPRSVPGLDSQVEADGPRLRVFTPEPAAVAARALTALGPDADRVRNIDLVSPSLEAVFLALTGRRYEADDASEKEAPDVVAP